MINLARERGRPTQNDQSGTRKGQAYPELSIWHEKGAGLPRMINLARERGRPTRMINLARERGRPTQNDQSGTRKGQAYPE